MQRTVDESGQGCGRKRALDRCAAVRRPPARGMRTHTCDACALLRGSPTRTMG